MSGSTPVVVVVVVVVVHLRTKSYFTRATLPIFAVKIKWFLRHNKNLIDLNFGLFGDFAPGGNFTL